MRSRPKAWRPIATRNDRLVRNYLASLALASVVPPWTESLLWTVRYAQGCTKSGIESRRGPGGGYDSHSAVPGIAKETGNASS